ncbi:MAG TPA: DUF3396 domain-containing protein [Nitrospira sp.]|nr:DUF3396 domain-containing protein [Nitrospira sp.]
MHPEDRVIKTMHRARESSLENIVPPAVRLRLKVCLDITVYWTGSVFQHGAGVLDFYRQSMELLGKHIKHYETETMGGACPVDADSLHLLPFWIEGTKARRSIYALFLESASEPNVPSTRAFSFRAWEAREVPVGMMRLVLPTDFFGKEPVAFVDLTKRLVRKLLFESGHAGYALNHYERGPFEHDALEAMYVLSRKYPGLDIPSPTSTLFVISEGLKRVNWLTLLGSSLSDRLGGVVKLKNEMGEEIDVYALDHGVLIQAGPEPEIGDVNRRGWLPFYHHVGRVLAPIRAKNHPGFFMHGMDFDEEATEEWLARFDS